MSSGSKCSSTNPPAKGAAPFTVEPPLPPPTSPTMRLSRDRGRWHQTVSLVVLLVIRVPSSDDDLHTFDVRRLPSVFCTFSA